MWLAPTILAVGIAIAGTMVLTAGPASDLAAGQGGDAAPTQVNPVGRAVLLVESVPTGASVWLDGELAAGKTPVRLEVRPDVAHRVEIAAEGHERFVETNVIVQPGERVRLPSRLVRHSARLEIKTRPPGANVTLDGELLGTTPLSRAGLPSRKGLKLEVSKSGFFPIQREIDLVAGETAKLDERLRSAVRYGKINLSVRAREGGRTWANVYLKGKKIGQAPGTLRLPVGTHRLKLVNPESKKSSFVRARVYDSPRVETYSGKL